MREMSLASYSLRIEISERRRNIFMFKGLYVRPSVGSRSLSLTRILISLLCQNCFLLRHKCTKRSALEKSKTENFQTKRPRKIYDNYSIKKYRRVEFFTLIMVHLDVTKRVVDMSTCTIQFKILILF